MLLTDRTYARVIAWAKIGLPLLALVLLSTLFMFSKSAVQTPDIPFSEADLRDRVQGQVLTAPYYNGTTEDGATVSLQASRARPEAGRDGRAVAEDVMSRLVLAGGEIVDIEARLATLDDRMDQAELTGAVVIETSTGYRVETSAVVSGLRTLRAETLGPVDGFAPEGRLSAGRLLVTSDADGGAQFLFTDGVKLIYDPAREE